MNIQKVIKEAIAGSEWKDLIKSAAFLLLSILIVAVLVRTVVHFTERPKAVPRNFIECMAFGYPVRESYPRQCAAGDKVFAETIR